MRSRRGSVAVVIGLALTAIIGMVALGTEVVFVLLKHREMQAAADAAALGGATALATGYPANLAVETQAIASAAGFTSGTAGITVTVHNPPLTGPNVANANAVEVIVNQPQTLSMISLFRSATMDVGARAVAIAGSASSDCVLVLDPTAQNSASLSGGATLTLKGCGLGVNSTSSSGLNMSGGATITTSSVSLGGASYGSSGGSKLTSTKPIAYNQSPIANPYSSRTIPSFSGCLQTNLQISHTPASPLNPGVYCGGINISGGATVTLNPGSYIMNGGNFNVSGGSTVNGTGVTIILTTSTSNYSNIGAIIVSGGSGLNISAPTSGGLSGMAIWVDSRSPNTNQDNISGGAAIQITGLIYMPSVTVTYSGGSSTGNTGCTQLIAYEVNFSGGLTFENNCSGTGTSPIGASPSQLVE